MKTKISHVELHAKVGHTAPYGFEAQIKNLCFALICADGALRDRWTLAGQPNTLWSIFLYAKINVTSVSHSRWRLLVEVLPTKTWHLDDLIRTIEGSNKKHHHFVTICSNELVWWSKQYLLRTTDLKYFRTVDHMVVLFRTLDGPYKIVQV